jgi:replicative DNA helicase
MESERITYLPEINRLLPQSADAERGLLSSFLQSPRDIGALCGERRLTGEHLHLPAHSIIFDTLLRMWEANEPIDIITVTQRLRDKNQIDSAGGAALVTDLFTFLPTASNAAYYIGIVEEKRILRDIIKVCTEYASRSYAEQDEVANLLSEATSKICAIGQRVTTERPKTPLQHALDANDRAMERVEKRGLPDNVIRTGLKQIDDAMSGIRPGDYVLVSGKEKSGKTTFAFNIFEHAVFKQHKRTAVVSMEMKSPEIIDRLCAQIGWINLTNILNGWMSEEESTKFQRVTAQISNGTFHLFDSLQTLGQSVATLRQCKANHPDLELAIIDYLQLIEADSVKRREDMREQVIAGISRTLRKLAHELNIAIIMLVQLNEDGQVRESRSPGMDCTAHIRLEPGKEEGLKWARIVYQRNGPSNVGIPLAHLGQFLRFEESSFTEPEQAYHPKKRDRQRE